MTRFATFFAVAGLTGAAVAPALAQQTPLPARAPLSASRVVMLCDIDAATRIGFRREYGSAPVFVTAEQALQARATGQSWTTPRCMTAREHGRLVQTLSASASVR